MGIVQWNCKQSSSYRSNYHSCPYVHMQREFLQFLGLMLCASIIFFSLDLVSWSADCRENCMCVCPLWTVEWGEGFPQASLSSFWSLLLYFVFPFSGLCPLLQGNFLNKVMDIVAQDLLREVRWLGHSPIQTAELHRNCLLVLTCTKQEDKKDRFSFLSWNTR